MPNNANYDVYEPLNKISSFFGHLVASGEERPEVQQGGAPRLRAPTAFSYTFLIVNLVFVPFS